MCEVSSPKWDKEEIKTAMWPMLPYKRFKGLLTDAEIRRLCEADPPLIRPFVPEKSGFPSYGLSSFGYDIRIGNIFLVPRKSKVVDPRNIDHGSWDRVEIPDDGMFIIEPGQFVLGESIEWFNIPNDILGICVGKSTWARIGVIVHITPLEPGWRHSKLTIEISNISPNPVIIRPGDGIAQIIFLRSREPLRDYSSLGGRYSHQSSVTLPRQEPS